MTWSVTGKKMMKKSWKNETCEWGESQILKRVYPYEENACVLFVLIVFLVRVHFFTFLLLFSKFQNSKKGYHYRKKLYVFFLTVPQSSDYLWFSLLKSYIVHSSFLLLFPGTVLSLFLHYFFTFFPGTVLVIILYSFY